MKRFLRITALLVLLTLLFTLTLSLTACTPIFSVYAGTDTVLSKEAISENMLSEKNDELEYVWRYLNRWDLPLFNKTKMKRIEKIFRDVHYKELPSSYELAKATCEYFLENSYGKIDLSDPQRVSDELLTAFVKSTGDRYAYYRTNVQYDDYKDEMSGTKPSFYGIGIEVPQPTVKGGILITDVASGSPAESAGLRKGDRITEIHTASVDGMYFEDAVAQISETRLEKILITVKRGENEINLSVAPDRSGAYKNHYNVGLTLNKPTVESELPISKVIRNAPAHKAGLLKGDSIIAVDGEAVAGLTIDAVTDKIKGNSGTEVTVTVKRGGETLDIKVTRGPVVNPTVDFWIEGGNIGFIKINSFKDNTDEFFKEAVDYMKQNGAEAIIYDVRNNGGGYLDSVLNMLDYIAADGTTLVSFSNDYAKSEKANDGHAMKIPAVVICNGSSASAAELFTVGMRDLGAMGQLPVSTVGQTTYGKFVMQNSYSFLDGSAVTLTVAYYYSPKGDEYNGVGITPGIVVAGAPEQELAAIEEAKRLIANK